MESYWYVKRGPSRSKHLHPLGYVFMYARDWVLVRPVMLLPSEVVTSVSGAVVDMAIYLSVFNKICEINLQFSRQ